MTSDHVYEKKLTLLKLDADMLNFKTNFKGHVVVFK